MGARSLHICNWYNGCNVCNASGTMGALSVMFYLVYSSGLMGAISIFIYDIMLYSYITSIVGEM